MLTYMCDTHKITIRLLMNRHLIKLREVKGVKSDKFECGDFTRRICRYNFFLHRSDICINGM